MLIAVKTRDCANLDFLIFVIMTHGDINGTLCAKDGDYNLDHDFINVIQENETLANIPKIFIVQACRGHLQLEPASISRLKPVNASRENDPKVISTQANHKNLEQNLITTKINTADTLKIFSTSEGFTSLRDIDKGTIFIQAFCDKLEEFGGAEDLESIVKRVISKCLEQ